MSIRPSAPEPGFYVTGGTLRRDAPCYVMRQADEDLYQSLLQGKFCYVLTPRQMGKSSLMIRTTARLIKEEAGAIILDLTAVGHHLSVEQWYGGLLAQIGSQVDLEDELFSFWEMRKLISPLQRWMTALCEIVLPRYPNRLTVFIDEIDAVRSLPFSTDEFFAGIRELYNRRAQTPALERLTFCLLGVATPSDLIGDTQATPFNIGRRIELHDFTEEEAKPLAQGLNRGFPKNARLLKRILYWTNGHPYLTQLLCQGVAENTGINNARGVDHLCDQLFLSLQARELDDNLLFVRDRLLRGPNDLAALLELYNRIHRGGRVNDDETNPLFSVLKLSGITRVEKGRLVVRNQIYAHAFDQKWVQTNMPGAEYQRQQAAFQRGVIRATAAILAILLAIALPILFAIQQHENQGRERRQLLYAAQMSLVAQDWENANIIRLHDLLATHLPAVEGEDFRGFEWYYFWRLLHRERRIIKPGDQVLSVAFSPNGKLLATGDRKALIKLWDATAGNLLATFSGHQERIWKVVFSPDGKRLASASWDDTVKIWDVEQQRQLFTIPAHEGKVCGLAFSPDGQMLVSGGWDKNVRLWEAETGKLLKTFSGHQNWVWDVAFSPDGRQIASASEDFSVRLWDVKNGEGLFTLTGEKASIYDITFSPDGTKLASCGNNGQVEIWDPHTGQNLLSFKKHTSSVNSVQFSPDGQRLVSVGVDRVIRFWRFLDTGSFEEYAQLKGHSDEIRAAAFSPDGWLLATGGEDATARLWEVPQNEKPELLIHPDEQTQSLNFSSDGKRLATCSQQTIYLRDVTSGEVQSSIQTPAPINDVAFSPDGKMIAAAHRDKAISITLWNSTTGQFIDSLKGHTENVNSLAFTPDGKFLVSGSRDGLAKLWDLANRKEASTFAHYAGVKSVAISRDGQFLATGSDDQTAVVWDLKTRKSIVTLRGHLSEVWSVAFSADGNRVATGSQGRSIKLWDWRRSNAILTLYGHSVGVRALAISPDGKRLASGDESGTIKLWDLATGNELVTLYGHKERITALEFSPNGLILASSSRDRSVRLWRAASKDQVANYSVSK